MINRLPVLLIFPFGYLSHYLRCLELARHLQADFHILFLHHDDYAGYIHSAGFETFRCQSFDAEEVKQHMQKFDFSWLNEASLEQVFRAQVSVLKELKAAAVLGDAMPGLKMAAESCNLPYISLINGYMSRSYRGCRQLPRGHMVSRLLRQAPPSLTQLLTRFGEAVVFGRLHRAFKRLRRKYGLRPTEHYLEEWEGDRTLIADLPALFAQKALPRGCQFLAPLICLGNDKGPLAAIVRGKKTIYVSLGSTGNWEQVAFLNHPAFGKYQIIAAGDVNGLLSANHIVHISFASVRQILPHTDLVICHGGNGTIYQALYYGIPVLCSPAHFEQEWNVEALRRLGLGDFLQHTNPEATLQTLEDWSSRKNSGMHALIAQQLAEACTELPEQIRALAIEILQQPTYSTLPTHISYA